MTVYNKSISTHQTLAANTVDTVNLSKHYGAVEVYNASSADIWARSDGTAPAVAGDDTIRIPGGSAATLGTPGDTTSVQLIASSTAAYSVTGLSS